MIICIKKGTLKISMILLALALILGVVMMFNKVESSDASYETINYETNEKTVSYSGITIKSPYIIVCDWNNASSNWKDCSVVIEVSNGDTKNDLSLLGDTFSTKFLKNTNGIKVYTTYDYLLYNDSVLNGTCYKNLSEEQKFSFLSNPSLCYYNYTRKSFYNFKQVTKLDKIHKDSVMGIKLEFQSPIEIETYEKKDLKSTTSAKKYSKNTFNFTLLGDYNMTLDPDVSECSNLNQSGATYTMTADILDSGATTCMNISADNITLDCQGHIVDSLGVAGGSIGILAGNVDNVTIKNCTSSHWTFSAIDMSSSNNSVIINSTADSNFNSGLSIISCINCQVINSTGIAGVHGISFVNNNDSQSQIISSKAINNDYGFSAVSSNNSQIINSSSIGNDYGIAIVYGSSSNIIYSNNITNSNIYGILYYSPSDSGSNKIYNNLFNNTNNFGVVGSVYENYWNTTNQTGARIYSNGNQIGGNYWTNSNGNGYSDTCTDSDYNGFCDSPLNITNTQPCTAGTDCDVNNTDYIPLSDEYYTDIPFWSSNQTNIVTTYSSTIHSHFNISWEDNGNNLDKILFESNYSGSAVNYTMSNSTYGGVIYNYSGIMSAGTFYWKSYANDSFKAWNSSDTWYFTINKIATNPVHLTMSSNNWIANTTDGNISVKTTDTVYAFAYMDYSNAGTVNLYVDGSSVSSLYSNTFGEGEHTIKVNTSGNTNYTFNSTGITFYIISTTPVSTGGGGGGGGETSPLTVYAHLGEQCNNETACASGLTCENSICIATETEFCGNGVCDMGETFLNCSKDCPSQSAVVAQAQFVIIALSLGYVLVMKPRIEKKRKKRED